MLTILFFIIAFIIMTMRRGHSALARRSLRSNIQSQYEDILNEGDSFAGGLEFNYGYRANVINRPERDIGNTLIMGAGIFLAYIFVLAGQYIWAALSIMGSIFCNVAYGRRLEKSNRRRRREEALAAAKIFLSPYKDIWRSLTLSNKFCKLKLEKDGKTITGVEKKKDSAQPYRIFRVVESHVFDWQELWNMFCTHFAFNDSYEGLRELCNVFNLKIVEDVVVPQPVVKDSSHTPFVQTDVNNASEAELTALPGINIVISKKIIKKRESIGGFKNTEDFLLFVKLKPNVTEQLRQKICVNKMKGVLKIERHKERIIDL